MTKYYNPKRSRNLFDPKSDKPFKLSRSKLELFVDCPRCFYVDRRLGTGRPPGFPFALNSAVDALLKKEFDIHRAQNKQHPLQKEYNIDAVPVHHEDLDVWRENFKGIQFHHKKTNFIITGAIDDLWKNSDNKYVVVDYKATSKDGDIKSLNLEWHGGYKRQMEIYQWLLRSNKYSVSNVGYFVYCNGITDKEAFDAKLEFDITVIPYSGDDKWVDKAIVEAHNCLVSDDIPESNPDCDYCAYVNAVNDVL